VIDWTGAFTLVRRKCLKGENISHISAKYLREEHLIARLATADLTIPLCNTAVHKIIPPGKKHGPGEACSVHQNLQQLKIDIRFF
jgi:hypothetical protein